MELTFGVEVQIPQNALADRPGLHGRWASTGVIGQIRDQLAARIRREIGKGPRAVATVIDSQSVKAASTVGRDSRGYDAGKKVNGRYLEPADLVGF